MMIEIYLPSTTTLHELVMGARAMGCRIVLDLRRDESLDVDWEAAIEEQNEHAKEATIKAIMSVLNAWQDSKLEKRCAEEILAAIERMA